MAIPEHEISFHCSLRGSVVHQNSGRRCTGQRKSGESPIAVSCALKHLNTPDKAEDNVRPVAQEFRKYEAILSDRYPAKIAEAKLLADKIVDPNGSDANSVWSVLWDKPLFANTRVSVAERWCAQLNPHMAGAWKLWGQADHFMITKTGRGIQRSSFAVTGQAGEAITRSGIALHRLYAIQGAARATRQRAASSDKPFEDLPNLELHAAVELLREEFGSGWGPITILHFLTDLGLAVKPDLHLMRTMQHFSGPLTRNGTGPSFSEAIAVNRAVRVLGNELGLEASPTSIRYLDKVLMEISRQGLI